MKKAGIPSMELERSMNMQVRIMTVEEALRHSDVIDKEDDKRRDKLHKIVAWTKDMQKSFINSLKEITESCKEQDTKEKLKILYQKEDNFYTNFLKAINEVLRQEIEYEMIDDRNREYLIRYASQCREDLRNENSKIERAIITKKVMINESY